MFGPLNPPLADWAGKRVWVIGASTGIGAALARRLIRAGARVALSARDAGRLAEVAGLSPQVCLCPLDVAGLSPQVCLCPLDVAEPGALQRVATDIAARWGGVDAVFFVAARYRAVRAWELETDDIDATLRTNVAAVMQGCAAVLPAMLERGSGALVIVSSVAGYRGLPKALVYGASKAALINFAEALYLDLHPRGLGVHLVCPGFVETPLTANNDFHMPALISPDAAAGHILSGLRRGDFHIHFPKRFTRWLLLLRLLPGRLYFAAVRKVTGL